MLAALLCALLALPAAGLPGDGDAPIQWGERRLRISELPDELPPSARAALEAWHAWASAHAYRLDLDRAGRVLVLARASNDSVPALLARAVEVVERFDRELPAPPVRLAAAPPVLVAEAPEKPKPASGDAPIPEDPEDPEGGHPWKLAPPKPAPSTVAAPVITTWGAQGQPLDTETIVLFVLTDQDDFESLLKDLAGRFPFLAAWSAEAKALHGFVLGEPLAGAYLERPEGVEEWNPENELVNRLARLCLLRRFGDLPNWFVQGYAWHAELALLGAVYCFPWRDEFVWATEHTGWHDIVKQRYLKARLKPNEFLGWKRGKYLEPEAKASWATSEYLVAKEKKLPELLDRLRVYREEHGRIQENPSTWRRDLEYEIPLGEQHALLTEVLGPDYLEHATFYFRQELVR
jgi:hypothetical protein